MTKITPELWKKSWDPHVKENLEYSNESLGILYTRAMAEFPDRPACWMMDREISFGELLSDVKKFATYLQKNGIRKGDVVAINLNNCPQYLIAHFATLLVGAVATGVNPLLSEREMAYQLTDSKAKALVTLDVIFEKRLLKFLDDLPNLKVIVATDLSKYMGFSKIKVFLAKKIVKKIPTGKVSDWPGKKVVRFSEIMENTTPDVKQVDINVDEDLALLQYTGGTTGFPKGTELTHRNMIANHTIFANWLNLEKGKVRTVSAFPMFHLAGLTVAALIPEIRTI
jgi:long-chain acyl-CoA synthetase